MAGLDDFEPLNPAEQRLIAEIGSVETVVFGQDVPPEDAGPERGIRAGLIAWLMRGGGAGVTVPETGVQVIGARITGQLMLWGARCPRSLGLVRCRIDATPVLMDVEIDNLFLNDSDLPGLVADRLVTRGNVHLRGANVTGPVVLAGARLGGNLECNGATLTAPTDQDNDETALALVTNDIETHGVDLDCATVTGEVRLVGAKLRGNLYCRGATLTAGKTGDALCADGARIDGALFLWPYAGGKTSAIQGRFSLTGTRIGTIIDDASCWPRPGSLGLNRCVYDAFVGGPVDAESRIDWLGRQDRSAATGEFQPQPWEQCARVLREMGHRADARTILIEKERRQRAAGRAKLRAQLRNTAPPGTPAITTRAPLIGGAVRLAAQAAWDGTLGAVLGYGHDMKRVLIWLGAAWLLGVLVFAIAFAQGAMKPNNAFILRSVEWAACADDYVQKPGAPETRREPDHASQLACFQAQPEAAGYPRFNPWVYSADTLLPVVNLELQGYWVPDAAAAAPIGAAARAFLWLQILAGWALSLLAVAGFSGLVRSD
jgi:hypothetical protein